MKTAKLKPVSNPHLRKAANTGKNFQPNAQAPAGQPVTVKKTKFTSQRGV